MSATVRVPDNKFEFRDWRIDVMGDRTSMTLMAADGTSLMIDDAENAEFLRHALAQYLRTHHRREAEIEDEAHRRNALLHMGTNGDHL